MAEPGEKSTACKWCLRGVPKKGRLHEFKNRDGYFYYRSCPLDPKPIFERDDPFSLKGATQRREKSALGGRITTARIKSGAVKVPRLGSKKR